MFSKIINRLVFLLFAGSSLWACTIGVFSGSVTVDGRPILWKNRDVSNSDQEYAYFDDGRYDYITNIYNGQPNKAWAGINSAGFGIVNSDTYNNGNSLSSGPDDGTVMKYALMYCQTVEDFEDYLDSTGITGRRNQHNYGVIDAFGGAALFEAGNYSHVRFDADDEDSGFIIRTNFAFSGGSNQRGIERYNSAMTIMDHCEYVDYRFVIENLACDLSPDGENKLNLPFFDEASPYPFGYISTYETINRNITRSASVIIGKREAFDDIEYPVVWALLGQPILSVPIPLWVNAREVSDLVDGFEGSEVCHVGMMLRNCVYDTHLSHYFNTAVAAEIVDFFHDPIDDIYEIFETGMRNFASQDNTKGDLIEIQDTVMGIVAALYNAGRAQFVHEGMSLVQDRITLNTFPNPFNGSLSIEIISPEQVVDIFVYDILGNRVDVIGESYDINISSKVIWEPDHNIPTGVYLVAAKGKLFGTSVQKVVYVK